jgi:hypothetical protein
VRLIHIDRQTLPYFTVAQADPSAYVDVLATRKEKLREKFGHSPETAGA